MDAQVKAASAPTIAEEFRQSWRPMIAIILGICFAAIPAYSLGAFIEPLSREFGWSVTEVAAWMMFWSMGAIVAAPVAGSLADRIGPKPVAIVSLTALAAILAGTALFVNGLWLYYASAFSIGAIVSGTSAITYGRVIASLFSAGLGTALGLMSTGIGIAAIIGPRLMQAVIDAHDWQVAYYVLAAFPLIILPLLLAWLPEGKRKQRQGFAPILEEGHNLATAIRMPVFWAMSFGALLYGLCVGGVSVNLMPFLASEGLSRAEAASAVGLFGFATVAGRFLTGILIDRVRIHASVLMAIVLACEAGAFLLLAFGGPGAALLIALPVFGFAVGAEADCLAYCTVRIFGRRNYGSIFSLLGITMLYIGTGVGPVLFSVLQETLGNYPTAFVVWSGLAMLAVPIFLWVARIPFFVSGTERQ